MDRSEILSVLRKRKTRALHVSEICGRINVPSSKRNEVHALLETLAEEGLVTQLPGGRFRARVPHKEAAPPVADPPLAASPLDASAPRRGTRGRRTHLLTGRLTMNPRGFGFVSTEEEGPDVFIPPPLVGAALHGDRVQVEVHPSAQGLEGRIVEVLQRGMSHVSGVLRRAGKSIWVEPDDPRMRAPVGITGTPPKAARPGMFVISVITEYPTHARDVVQARVLEAVNTDQIATFEVTKTLLREGVVDESFSEAALEEAKRIPSSVPTHIKKQREDLRGLDLVTIDPVDARDHDDAMWAERTADGYRVVVAIADVSHYVPEGSALDAEALARGCTIYLPSRAIPMLPMELAASLASLVPGKDRLTMAVEITLSERCAVTGYRFIEGLMRSRAKLTYEGVARALGLTTAVDPQPGADDHLPLLQVLREVAQKLRAKRTTRGALNFELPEGRVSLDVEGNPQDIYQSRRDPGVSQAYNLVEEMMLLANEVVATEFARRKLPTIYRVHPQPDADRVAMFAEVASAAGYKLDADAGQNPKLLQRFLKRVAKSPQARALEFLLLRAMQQASYSTINEGHFGLAAKNYLHFTSPIRRYPDLAVHRLVRKLARGQRIDTENLLERLQMQAGESSRLERRAMKIERDVIDLYGALLMQAHVEELFDATITGVAGHGVFASIEAPFVTVMLRVEELPDDRYEIDEHGLRLHGVRSGRTFGLGDVLRVRISDISLPRRQVYAVCAEMPPRSLVEEAPADDGRRTRRPQRDTQRSGTKAHDVPVSGRRRRPGAAKGPEKSPAKGSGKAAGEITGKRSGRPRPKDAAPKSGSRGRKKTRR